ncbi:MAG TPA: hypothetical protein PKE30_21735 [Niabella sp.]|nr:hypothetical protein [Niabella sp.]
MIGELQKKLEQLQSKPLLSKALIGFDGYIDLIQKVVKSSAKESRQYYNCLYDVGEHISAASGKSAQLEVCTITKKLGGNAPIMANSLAHLGIDNYCIGTMGYPNIQEVFLQMHKRCKLFSIGEPGITNALEFEDGKLMLSELSSFETLDLQYILNLDEAFLLDEYLKKSRLIAMVDWANLPLCTQLWMQMRTYILDTNIADNIYFFDLCDPSKKTVNEIREVLNVINTYKELGKVIVGLNENEAIKVYKALEGMSPSDAEDWALTTKYNLEEITSFIFKAMHIDILLVHPTDRCLAATHEGVIRLNGNVVKHPKVLTGGGDNLNAGFCFGLLNSFSIEECMMLGMATSGAYIQNGKSPSIDDLISYLQNL